MATFVRDLRLGDKGQQIVVAIFNKCGLSSTIVDSKNPNRSFWDIETTGIDGGDFTTEVKYDVYEARSGNIAIETFNPRSGKPSGLGITRAFFWAHVLADNSVWLARVSDLKKFVQDQPPKKVVECGGDDNATLLLYQNSIILDGVFTRVDLLDGYGLLKFLEEQLCPSM